MHATSTSGAGDVRRRRSQAAAIATALAGFPLHDGAGLARRCCSSLAARRARAAGRAALRSAGRRCVAGAGRDRRVPRRRPVRVQRRLDRGRSSRRWPARSSGSFGTLLLGAPAPIAGAQPRAGPDRRARRGNQRTRRLRALLLLGAAFGVVAVALVARRRPRCCATRIYSTVDLRFGVRGSEAAAEGRRARRDRRQDVQRPTEAEWPLDRDALREGASQPHQGRGEGDRRTTSSSPRTSGDHEGRRRARSRPCTTRRKVVLSTTETDDERHDADVLRSARGWRTAGRHPGDHARASRTPTAASGA